MNIKTCYKTDGRETHSISWSHPQNNRVIPCKENFLKVSDTRIPYTAIGILNVYKKVPCPGEEKFEFIDGREFRTEVLAYSSAEFMLIADNSIKNTVTKCMLDLAPVAARSQNVCPGNSTKPEYKAEYSKHLYNMALPTSENRDNMIYSETTTYYGTQDRFKTDITEVTDVSKSDTGKIKVSGRPSAATVTNKRVASNSTSMGSSRSDVNSSIHSEISRRSGDSSDDSSRSLLIEEPPTLLKSAWIRQPLGASRIGADGGSGIYTKTGETYYEINGTKLSAKEYHAYMMAQGCVKRVNADGSSTYTKTGETYYEINGTKLSAKEYHAYMMAQGCVKRVNADGSSTYTKTGEPNYVIDGVRYTEKEHHAHMIAQGCVRSVNADGSSTYTKTGEPYYEINGAKLSVEEYHAYRMAQGCVKKINADGSVSYVKTIETVVSDKKGASLSQSVPR